MLVARKQPLTRPAMADENAVAVHPLPKGEGGVSRKLAGVHLRCGTASKVVVSGEQVALSRELGHWQVDYASEIPEASSSRAGRNCPAGGAGIP